MNRDTAESPPLVNIGNAQPVELLDFIAAIEAATGCEVEKEMLPIQPGDVPATRASTELLERLTGGRPEMPVREGVARFVEWYRGYLGA